MGSIQSIIKRLGYDKSDNLLYLSEINTCETISWHDKRVINELSPYAVYVVDDSALVAFFDDLCERVDEDIQCKIWNAQIPIIISDEGNWVKIYNGKSMQIDNGEKIRLTDIANYNVDQCDETNNFSYWNITSNRTLSLYEKDSAKKNLNDFLIGNLKFLTSELKEKYHISFANKLVLRILFIRYLIDRGVCIGYKGLDSNIKETQNKFLEIVRDKKEIFLLFKFLKQEFNGNLFEMDEQSEWREVSDSALIMLYDFLTAKIEMKTGQYCLFPFYDFNIIPIELISNIYEILLGKDKQDKDKAFYTPEYLADYIIQHTVGKRLMKSNECAVFDPSCGSGIFLVKALRKILEKNSVNGYIYDKEKINRLVKSNIYGVDYNEEAVDVTIFSLYITLFDFQDPKNLKEFQLPLLKGENIFFGDFFDENILKLIDGIKFEYVVGNPPWGKMQQEGYKKYCASKNVTPQDGEISVAFLLKVQEVGNENTECSLVIPSKILYKGKKPSCEFRKKFLSNVCMRQILEISSVRKQIFKGATAPAAVLSFVCHKAPHNHKLEYISLKPNKFLRLYGIIMIEPDDVKYVLQELLLKNDWLWKVLVYGSYWDYELIDSLRKEMPIIEDVAKEYGLILKKGIEDHVGVGQDASHLVGRRIIDSDGCIEPFCISLDNAYFFNKSKIHRVRAKEIFEPPYVLFKKGLNCEDYSIRAAYTEERLLYKCTISCIKGNKEDKNILLNFEGLLNSSLFTYLNFMLGSSVGIEREQVFLDELERFPYAYSENLVELVKKMHLAIQNNSPTEEIKKKIDNCVFEMYGVQNNYFINYALKVQIPMLCGNYTESKCNSAMLIQYAEVFSNVWDKRLERSNISYSINLYPNIKGRFAAFYMCLSFDKRDNTINIMEEVDDNLTLLTNFMIYKLNDCFYQTKNIGEFDDDAFVIVKPIESRNWHAAMAIKDSYRVLNAVLLGEEDCE